MKTGNLLAKIMNASDLLSALIRLWEALKDELLSLMDSELL